jgi:tetratricopeptide (TPR) repeat protein
MRWLLLLLAVTGLALAAQDERTDAYLAFRSAFDAGDYITALPLATRVVDMTAGVRGPDAPEMANALSNLGTTYYRLRNYEMALDTYRRALDVLDAQGDATDLRLLRPLHGMGVVLRALDRGADAIVPLKRAVDITRNRDGLHAASQLPLLHPLIDSYLEAGRFEDAARERQFAFSVAESLYGKDDLRLLPAIEDQARWNEMTGNFAAARQLHARAVQIAEASDPRSLAGIPGLRGIARSYRLGFVFGETQAVVAADSMLAGSAFNDPLMPQVVRSLPAVGEQVLLRALDLLAGMPEQARLRGEVLLDLGDWYLTANQDSRALAAWSQAWTQFTAAGDAQPLAQPALVIYRPPAIAVSRRLEDPEDHLVQEVELRLAIGANGAVKEATVANPDPQREAAERAVIAAVRRAGWRPAFSNGTPTATTDYLFREQVFVKRPKQAG